MKINSKKKGNSFELKVAKMLTEWSGEEFHRTPMSGALHWENDNRVLSDIVPPQTLLGWPLSIECKKVETSWEFSSLIEGTALFWRHWEQCWEDSQRENMIPMLIFNKNYREIYVAITVDTFQKLELDIENTIQLNYDSWKLVLIKFKDFLDNITCEELISKNLLCNNQG